MRALTRNGKLCRDNAKKFRSVAECCTSAGVDDKIESYTDQSNNAREDKQQGEEGAKNM